MVKSIQLRVRIIAISSTDNLSSYGFLIFSSVRGKAANAFFTVLVNPFFLQSISIEDLVIGSVSKHRHVLFSSYYKR